MIQDQHKESIGSYPCPEQQQRSDHDARKRTRPSFYRLIRVNLAGGRCGLDCKFFCKKVAPSLEFVTRLSEIGVFAKEGKQEIFWSDHANGNDPLIR